MKHRIWCKDKNEWETGITFVDANGTLLFQNNGILQPVNMKNNILEFSSGVVDKNGTEIFEGDIVFVPYNYIGNRTVTYAKGVWSFGGFNIKHLEIIGNIHEPK